MVAVFALGMGLGGLVQSMIVSPDEINKESPYLIHSYSERLIELYHVRKEYSLEKAERRFDFMSYQAAGVEDFRFLMYKTE